MELKRENDFILIRLLNKIYGNSRFRNITGRVLKYVHKNFTF